MTETPKSRPSKVGALVLAALLIAGALVLWFPYRPSPVTNEHAASGVLARLSWAEAEFMSSDLDGNGVKDFWTGDVAGLVQYLRSDNVHILDRGIFEADASPLHPLVPKPVPYHGYYFMALEADEGENPPEAYRQDTDKRSGKVHHLKKWAFCAFPSEVGVTGRYVYIIDENNSQLRKEWLPSDPPPKNFPNSSELMKWSKFGG